MFAITFLIDAASGEARDSRWQELQRVKSQEACRERVVKLAIFRTLAML
jgi:hypothetical protein